MGPAMTLCGTDRPVIREGGGQNCTESALCAAGGGTAYTLLGSPVTDDHHRPAGIVQSVIHTNDTHKFELDTETESSDRDDLHMC